MATHAEIHAMLDELDFMIDDLLEAKASTTEIMQVVRARYDLKKYLEVDLWKSGSESIQV